MAPVPVAARSVPPKKPYLLGMDGVWVAVDVSPVAVKLARPPEASRSLLRVFKKLANVPVVAVETPGYNDVRDGEVNTARPAPGVATLAADAGVELAPLKLPPISVHSIVFEALAVR